MIVLFNVTDRYPAFLTLIKKVMLEIKELHLMLLSLFLKEDYDV